MRISDWSSDVCSSDLFPPSRSGGGQGWGRCLGIGPSEGQLFPDLPANQVPIVGVTCAASRQARPVMSAPAHYRLMKSIMVALVLLDALLLTSFVLHQWFEVLFWEAVGISALLHMPLTMLAMPLVDAVLADP